MVSSDSVAFIKIPIAALMINKGVDQEFQVWFGNSLAGTIHLISKFAPEGTDKYEEMKQLWKAQNEFLSKELGEANTKVEQMEGREKQLETQLAEL